MQPWVTSLEYILKYTQRGYFTIAAKLILLVTTCLLFYSGVSNSLILFYRKKADIHFKVRENKKRVLYPLQKTSIYRVILYLARIKTKSCNFLSAREQIATKIMGRQHVHCNVSKEIASADSPVIQLSSRER